MAAMGPCQRMTPSWSMATLVGDGADGGHVVGDGDGGGADLGDELADQRVDDAGEDRVEAGGGLVEEDDRRVGGDGAGEADALLHAAGELGRVEVGGLGAEADAGELGDGERAGVACARGACGRGMRRKATFCQTVRLSKSAPPWKSMPKWRRKARRSISAKGLPSIRICAGVRGEDAEDAFQRHRLAGAGAADDDEALAGHDLERDAGEHGLGAEGLADVAELDARHGRAGVAHQKKASVRR